MGQAAEVIVEELVLALVGLSAGAAVAGGLFSFIVELGVIADFADRTMGFANRLRLAGHLVSIRKNDESDDSCQCERP